VTNRIIPTPKHEDAAAAIEWLYTAPGFEKQPVVTWDTCGISVPTIPGPTRHE